GRGPPRLLATAEPYREPGRLGGVAASARGRCRLPVGGDDVVPAVAGLVAARLVGVVRGRAVVGAVAAGRERIHVRGVVLPRPDTARNHVLVVRAPVAVEGGDLRGVDAVRAEAEDVAEERPFLVRIRRAQPPPDG